MTAACISCIRTHFEQPYIQFPILASFSAQSKVVPRSSTVGTGNGITQPGYILDLVPHLTGRIISTLALPRAPGFERLSTRMPAHAHGGALPARARACIYYVARADGPRPIRPSNPPTPLCSDTYPYNCVSNQPDSYRRPRGASGPTAWEATSFTRKPFTPSMAGLCPSWHHGPMPKRWWWQFELP